MPETALYPPIKRFLEAAGFEVKGEVGGCDAVAVCNGEPLRLAIVEMKLGFSLDLLLQAVDRLRAADEVWLAVPVTRRGRDRDRRVHRLCRLIGIGLMAVDAARNCVEVLAEPGPYRPRSNQRRRARLLSEHARRRGDLLGASVVSAVIGMAVLWSAGRLANGDENAVQPDSARPERQRARTQKSNPTNKGSSCWP
jgi:hypothetical protein